MPRARERLRANRQQFLAPSVPPHACKLSSYCTYSQRVRTLNYFAR